ncbi:unnamed protein product [Cochlearia groenlandica]
MGSSVLKKRVWKNPFEFVNTKVHHHGGLLVDRFACVPNDLIETSIDGNVYEDYIELSNGISQGDVEAVNVFLKHRPDAVDVWINPYETPLLKACACGKPEIVKLLLRRMNPQQIVPEIDQNTSYHTPLTVAAVTGNMTVATYLIGKSYKLQKTPGINGKLPVLVAIENGHKDIAMKCFGTALPYFLEPDGYQAIMLILNAIYYNMLVFALDLLIKPRRHLAITKHSQIESIPIIVLASKPDLFPGGCRLGPLERIIYTYIQVKTPTMVSFRQDKDGKNTLMRKLLKCLSRCIGDASTSQVASTYHIEETMEMGLKECSETIDEALSNAVKYGNVDFLMEKIKNINSEILWSMRTSLFLLAVEFRQEKVFSLLLHGLDDRKYLLLADKDCNGNGVLHLAGYLSPPSKLSTVTGPALQMQRELQWFKEVERIVPAIEKERVNKDGQTPMEIFTKEHEALREEGEKWFKGTATPCLLVAALIATITFVAAAVSGGKQFHKDFIVSYMISFLAASTSVLIFLGILTARYSLDDFLVSLPTKMIAGLS